MKKISILCLLLLSALMMLVGCKADPEAINNTPEVFADEASDVLRTSAVLTGRIMAPAKASIKEYGFLVSSSSDFTSSDTQTIKCDEGLKAFSAQITDLEIGGTYFYAAYATGGLDRMTSTVRAFTTPTRSGVLLSDLRMVDEKTATFSARVADTGGGEINAVGLCWATDDTPTTYDETVITTLNSDNTFTASLTGLEAGKTYYVRAFADSDILGDGTTQTISYSRDVVEITLEEELPEPEPEPEPIWMLSGSLQGGENEIYFVEDSERGMFVAEDVNLTLWCRFKVYNVEDLGVAYGYADQTRTTHDMVDARLPLDLNGEDIEPTHAGVFDIWFDLDGKYLYIMSDGKTPEQADDYEPKPEETKEFDPSAIYTYKKVSSITEGKWYIIVANELVAKPLDSTYGYLSSCSPISISKDEIQTLGECAFGFYSVDDMYVILQTDGRYLYQVGSYNSLNADADPMEGQFWHVDLLDDETFKITNTTKNKYIQFDSSYSNFASYSDPRGTTPYLYELVGNYEPIKNPILPLDPEPSETWKIYYTSIDGNIVEPNSTYFYGANIVANTYENGQGVILFDAPVTSIVGGAFNGCVGLTSITIPVSVTEIGWYAFSGCTSLKEVYCNPTTPPIGAWYMFDENAVGRKIYVPAESVNAYKAAAYWSDYADYIYPMGEYETPETWKIYYTSTDGNIVEPYDTTVFGANIVSNTYENGQGVIAFDGEVTEIGANAFYGCTTLKEIYIPNGVNSLGQWNPFRACSNLSSFYGKFASEDNRCLIIDGVLRCFAPAGLTAYSIPKNTLGIYENAFYDCSELTSITIPESVISLSDDNPFLRCEKLSSFFGKFASQDNRCLIVEKTIQSFAPAGLTNYTIPQEATKIGNNAFAGCNKLEEITINDMITVIGGQAFIQCSSLKTISIPTSVQTIYSGAFASCWELTSVHCYPTTPPIASLHGFATTWDAFAYDADDRKIYVPNASVESYKAASGWSNYADCIYPMDTVEEVPETWKIYYASTDGNIVEPYDTTVFGANIVSNTYENGQGVILFDGLVTSIGKRAFMNCETLTSIIIPNGVTSIEGQAFYDPLHDGQLSSITIPNSVTSIGNQAFRGCKKLTTISIPESLTSIGNSAFNGCDGLTSVTIPDSVTSIGSSAFDGCDGLTSVTIGNGVASIGGSAFEDCTGLTMVEISDLDAWFRIDFGGTTAIRSVMQIISI